MYKYTVIKNIALCCKVCVLEVRNPIGFIIS